MEHNECQPIEDDEPKDIFLGQVVNNKDEAYNLYQAHAFKMGFSVRKGKTLYYDNEKMNIRLKDFYCSKQGFKNNESQGEAAYERADSRIGCEAMVRFNVSKEGVWKITKLVMNHNHDFVPPEQRHLLRSMRNISVVKGDVIKSRLNAGVKVTNMCSYLGEEVGGFDKLGITTKAMQNDDDASLLYRNAIMKSFYNLVLESQEHKETQQIMWNLLEIGVEHVQQCLSKLNLNPRASANDNSFIQDEENQHVDDVNDNSFNFSAHEMQSQGPSPTASTGSKRKKSKVASNKEKDSEASELQGGMHAVAEALREDNAIMREQQNYKLPPISAEARKAMIMKMLFGSSDPSSY